MQDEAIVFLICFPDITEELFKCLVKLNTFSQKGATAHLYLHQEWGEGEQCEPLQEALLQIYRYIHTHKHVRAHTHWLYKGCKHAGEPLENCKDCAGVPACAWLHFKPNRDNICCSQLVSQHSGNQMPHCSSLYACHLRAQQSSECYLLANFKGVSFLNKFYLFQEITLMIQKQLL